MCQRWLEFRKTENQACENMYTTQKRLPLLHLCTQSNLSQSTPYNDVRQQFTCFRSKLFRCGIINFKSTFGNKIDTTPLLSVCKKLWTPSFLSLNLAPYIHPHMRYKKLDHAHLSISFASRQNTASKLHQNLVLLFLRQQRHTTTNNPTNGTSRTMEPRLHDAQEISRRSQLHNPHRDVDVGRVAANKNKYCNPNHLNISSFKNHKPFILFGFTFMQLITWTIALITLFSGLNRLTMGAEVEFVHNVLGFVWNCTKLIFVESGLCN